MSAKTHFGLGVLSGVLIPVNAGRAPLGAPRNPPLSVFLMKVSSDFLDQTDTLSRSLLPQVFAQIFPIPGIRFKST